MKKLAESHGLIIDEYPLMRMGLKTLLTQRGVGRVFEADTEEEAVLIKNSESVDFAVVGYSCCRSDLLKLVERLAHAPRPLPVLLCAVIDDGRKIDQAFQAGAFGCVHKREAGDVIMRGITALLQGKKFVSPLITNHLAQSLFERSDRSKNKALSAKEREVFQCLGKGCSVAEIAVELCVSKKTIETHIRRVKEKTACLTTRQLIKMAIQERFR